jgi:hypothetical protein
MKSLFVIMTFSSCFTAANILAAPPNSSPAEQAKPAFSFADVKYFHRWSKDDQHEFTPADQENLEAWTDMVTINQYRKATDAESLAKMANAVQENYKQANGKIVRTTSIPRTKDKPAEHLIVVIFGRPNFYEIAFARFKMHDGKGASIVYSHRFYGKDASDKMRDWIARNGQSTEKNLMAWGKMPTLEGPK